MRSFLIGCSCFALGSIAVIIPDRMLINRQRELIALQRAAVSESLYCSELVMKARIIRDEQLAIRNGKK